MIRRAPLALAVLLACSCSPVRPQPRAAGASASLCSASNLARCEGQIASAMRDGADTDPWVEPYLSARAEAFGPADAWVTLWRRLQAYGHQTPPAVVVGNPAVLQATGSVLKQQYRRLRPADPPPATVELALPAPAAAPAELVLLAMARRARVGALAWLRDNDVVVVLGTDAWAPLTYRVPAAYVEGNEALGLEPASELASVLAVERATDQLLGMLGEWQFVEAAALMQWLDGMLNRVGSGRAAGLRARMVASRRGFFGMEKRSEPGAQAALDPSADPARLKLPAQGPYAAWMRSLLSRGDDKEAWLRQRAIVSTAVSPARLQAIDYAFGVRDARDGCAQPAPPADLLKGEPLLAGRLGALASDGTITPPQWALAYEALVTRVEQARGGWTMLPPLLLQRGELPGMSTRSSGQYKRVTRLALDYIAALQKVQKAMPERYQPAGQLTVALTPGAATDPEIADATRALVTDWVRLKLAPHAEPGKVFWFVVTSAISAMSAPEPGRSATLGALTSQLRERLQTDLQEQSGWQTASLYVVGALLDHFNGGQVDLAWTADQIARALEQAPDIRVRPAALLAARGTRYAALASAGRLEPEKVRPAGLGAGRAEARSRLKAALSSMAADGEKAPEQTLEALTTLLDGMIATSAFAVDKREAGKCIAAPRSALPAVRRNLSELSIERDRLVRDKGLWASGSTWSRRAGLLTVLLSDAVDLVSAREGAPVKYAISTPVAWRAVRDGVGEWAASEIAEGAAALHGLMRVASRDKDAWKTAVEQNPREMSAVFLGAASALGADGSATSRLALQAGAKVLQSQAARPGATPYVEALYAAGHPDQATIALLLSSVAAKQTGEPALRAEQLSLEHESPAAWALMARRAVGQTTAGSPLDAARFAKALSLVSPDRCKASELEPLANAGRAAERFARGEREEASRVIDDTLARAEREGLIVPRVLYRLAEPVGSAESLVMVVQMTTAQGFLDESSLSVGLEAARKHAGLKVDVVSTQAEDAGRLYAHLSAVGAVYHLLQGHDVAGAWNAERALQAIEAGVRLGKFVVHPAAKKWGEDSTELLATLFELALERNQPLLAADLLRAIPDRADLPDDRAIQTLSLRAIDAVAPRLAAARSALALVRQARACDGAKPSPAPDSGTCEQWRRSIALWRAGAYSGPGRMRAGSREKCTEESRLVELLQQLETPNARGAMPPRLLEHLVKTTARAVDSGYMHDARTLMRAARDAGICDPGLIETARRAARRSAVTPADRVEWLSYAMTCPGRPLDEGSWDDLAKLGDAAGSVPDPQTVWRVDAAVVRFILARQAWDKLHQYVSTPAFLEHMNRAGPAGGATAVAVEHAASIMIGRKPDLEASKGTYQVACIMFGDSGREVVCRELSVLRNRLAREPVSALVPTARRLLDALAL